MKHIKIFFFYGGATVFNATVSFITFSFLTHHLSKADYGIINLYASFSAFLLPFISVGVQYILSVDFFKLKEEEFRQHFTNALAVPLLATFFFTVFFVLSSQHIQNLLEINFFFAATIPLACLLTILVDVFLALFRNKEKHFLFTGFSTLKNSLEACLTVLFIVVLGYKWEGRLGSSLITLAGALIFICYIVYKWKYFTGKFEKGALAKNFKAGLPFIPERLAIFVLAGSDRFFIDHFSGLSDVGLYGAGAQIALIVNLAINILSSTFHPYLFRNLESRHKDFSKVKKVTITYLGVAALITMAVIFLIPVFFHYFIGASFRQGQTYAVYLTFGMFFWAIYNAFLPYLLIIKKNRLIMNISIVGMLASIILNYFNVRSFGAIGATYSTILVYFVMAALTIFFVHKTYNLRKVFE